jgi:hypothetical protein
MKHIVALSGGKDSTAMALLLQEQEPHTDFEFVYTPTGNELPEMDAHFARLRELLEGRMVSLSSGETLGSLVRRWNALPNWRQRWCTRVLKIEPFKAYLLSRLPATVYVGIRADEAEEREGVIYGDEVTRRFPLVEYDLDLEGVQGYLAHKGVIIPTRTDCALCFFQRLGEWRRLWYKYPKEYTQGILWERQTGHTFRAESKDKHAASLLGLAQEFTEGFRPRAHRMSDREAMCGVCAR